MPSRVRSWHGSWTNLQVHDVRQALTGAEVVIASDLTLIECDRVLMRAVALGELTEADAADRRAHLMTAASHWHLLRIGPEIVERARQPFPGEPVRTLDAIHLASALMARGTLHGLELLSLDDRIRRAGPTSSAFVCIRVATGCP